MRNKTKHTNKKSRTPSLHPSLFPRINFIPIFLYLLPQQCRWMGNRGCHQFVLSLLLCPQVQDSSHSSPAPLWDLLWAAGGSLLLLCGSPGGGGSHPASPWAAPRAVGQSLLWHTSFHPFCPDLGVCSGFFSLPWSFFQL